MVSTSGDTLLAKARRRRAEEASACRWPTLVTPNIPGDAGARRAARQASTSRSRRAGQRLIATGREGGADQGRACQRATVDDVLVWEGGIEILGFPRIKTRHTHGTGCTLPPPSPAGWREGLSLPLAVGRAREYVQAAIETAPGFGKGHGPLNHFAKPGA